MNEGITYSLLKAQLSKEYGIMVKQEQPQHFAVAMPFTKDLCRLQKIIQRLNQEQTSIEDFKEIYLSGNILEHI